MPEEGNKPRPSLADRVVKAGAVAAAIASIVGLVTLLWPDAEPEPSKRDASFEKVKVGPPVSLQQFASRQEFVAYSHADRPHRTLELEPPVPTVRAHTGRIRSRPVLAGLHHVYERAV